MKKQWIALLLIFGILLAAAGCTAAGALRAPVTAVSSDPSAVPAQTAAVTGQTAPAGSSLTRDRAEQAALDYLGFSPDQVSRLRSEYEVDDGIALYEISFIQGDWEYEFEIAAQDGRILSFDKDHKYD